MISHEYNVYDMFSASRLQYEQSEFFLSFNFIQKVSVAVFDYLSGTESLINLCP